MMLCMRHGALIIRRMVQFLYLYSSEPDFPVCSQKIHPRFLFKFQLRSLLVAGIPKLIMVGIRDHLLLHIA